MPSHPARLKIRRAKVIVDNEGQKFLTVCEICGMDVYLLEGHSVCTECKSKGRKRLIRVRKSRQEYTHSSADYRVAALLSQPGTCAVALRASFSTCAIRLAMNFLHSSHRLSLSEHVTPMRHSSQMKPYSTLVWQNWQKFIIEDGVYLDAVRGASPIGLSMSKRKILG